MPALNIRGDRLLVVVALMTLCVAPTACARSVSTEVAQQDMSPTVEPAPVPTSSHSGQLNFAALPVLHYPSTANVDDVTPVWEASEIGDARRRALVSMGRGLAETFGRDPLPRLLDIYARDQGLPSRVAAEVLGGMIQPGIHVVGASMAALVADVRRSSPTFARQWSDLREEPNDYTMWLTTTSAMGPEWADVYNDYPGITMAYRNHSTGMTLILMVINDMRIDLAFRSSDDRDASTWDRIRTQETLATVAHEWAHAHAYARQTTCDDPHENDAAIEACSVAAENLFRAELHLPQTTGYGFAGRTRARQMYGHLFGEN